MVIIITGTPGTGKSTLARKIAHEEERALLHISDLLEHEGLDAEWDANNQCFLVDVVRLNELLEEHIKQDDELIIDGHLSHEVSPEHVERCIVCKCDLQELKSRLEDREYSEQKVRENMDCEIFDICYTEAIERGHNPEVYWSSEKTLESIDE
jgi:adenylate kinase